ncbi:site-specific recombinase, DNA invertase Pin [Mycobacterium sp. JS623]|uniref:recombinase family protein n=1 Tax=Mycobacterium sp. JS623 TaxID=212767 RepID=UPI0002A5B8EF|nr:recombinase family protein [Mycobacterium sp. JS623]AGB21692.1 site-specific recombinase, DNA invertase Pin [Mycobacterium sp. JS623]
MRAIVYCRVSSDQTGEFRSVESQEEECRAVCARKGWDVAEVLVDNDRGASRFSTKDRPEWRKLSNILEEGDVLVMWEASRAQRDVARYVELRDLLAERGALWSYSGKLYDVSRGDDRFNTGLDALLAEREAEQIRERVLRGKRAAALKGLPGGRPAWGYKCERDHTGRTTGWVIDEEAEPLVREVFERVLAGESLWAITRDFTARGIQPPQLQKNARKDWKPQSLRVTISSPTYAGWRQHRGQLLLDNEGNRVRGRWRPYITDAQHERLLAIFSAPARKTTTHRGREPRHLLTGIAKCGICGAVMRYSDAPSSRARAARYLCEKRTCVGRRADAVDLLVEETILERMERPDAIKLFAQAGNDALTQALELADTLRKRLAGFVDQAADGKISPASLATIEAKLRPQIDAAEANARATVTSPLVARLAGPDARQTWARDFTIIDRRTVVASLLDIKIKKVHHGNTQRFDPRDIDVIWKTAQVSA